MEIPPPSRRKARLILPQKLGRHKAGLQAITRAGGMSYMTTIQKSVAGKIFEEEGSEKWLRSIRTRAAYVFFLASWHANGGGLNSPLYRDPERHGVLLKCWMVFSCDRCSHFKKSSKLQFRLSSNYEENNDSD